VAVQGLRGTNVGNTPPSNTDTSEAEATFPPSPAMDAVPRLPGRSPRFAGLDDTHYSLEQLASLTLQKCRRILPETGFTNMATQDPRLRRVNLAHEAGPKIVGSYLLSRNVDGGFTFAERHGPPGARLDSLSIKPDGQVSYRPGTRTKLDPTLDPVEAKKTQPTTCSKNACLHLTSTRLPRYIYEVKSTRNCCKPDAAASKSRNSLKSRGLAICRAAGGNESLHRLLASVAPPRLSDMPRLSACPVARLDNAPMRTG
jgi:hypothetical protein